jgi:hypothetical protein
MFRVVAAATILGLAAASGSQAGDKPKPDKLKGQRDPAALFQRLDVNGDGKISKDEFARFAEELREKAKEKGKGEKADGRIADTLFQRLDTNHDGFLSLEEFKKFSEMRGKVKDKGKSDTIKNRN